MSRYLIDTNILSEPIKPQPNPTAIDRMQQHTDDIAIAAVTWHEICSDASDYPSPADENELSSTYRKCSLPFQFCPTTQPLPLGTPQNALA